MEISEVESKYANNVISGLDNFASFDADKVSAIQEKIRNASSVSTRQSIRSKSKMSL